MRIRTIKPEFFLHESLFELEKSTKLPIRLAYIGLWCIADREGRFKWEPRKIGAQILPYDGCDTAKILDSLCGAGLIVRYGDAGEFGAIPTFLKHQHVNIREAKSILPEPPNDNACASTCIDEDARAAEFKYNGVNIPPNLSRIIFERDGNKCLRCGATNDLTVDHIFPRSMGGTHAATNLRTLCRSCNSARPVVGQPLLDDLAFDGLTMADKERMCSHVQTREDTCGREGKGREQGREGNKERERVSDALRIRLGAIMHRRANSQWTDAELKAFRKGRFEEDDIAAVEAYYAANWPPQWGKNFLRADLGTLLNNWPGEVDKARRWTPPQVSNVTAKNSPADETPWFEKPELP